MITKQIDLELIVADPDQPRKTFNESLLVELKNSIATQGILTPLLVESNYDGDKYLLLDGERRYRCSKELNIKSVPAQIVEGPLTFDERTSKRFHIQEQHSNWTELDKARAIYKYKQNTGKSIAEIAESLNIHVPKVHAYLSVTDFTEEGEKLITDNNIDFTYLIFLVRCVKYYLSISENKQEYIEERLINKIISDVFRTVSEFQLFSKIICAAGHEDIKLEFLNSSEFSFEEFINKSKDSQQEKLMRFHKSLVSINHILEEIITKEYTLSEEHKNTLKSIKDKINKLLI